MKSVASCDVEKKRLEQVWGRRVYSNLRDLATTFDAGL